MAYEARGVDFESDLNPAGRESLRLRRGADFDQVVLGIPVGALAPICEELMDRDESFRTAIESAVDRADPGLPGLARQGEQ